jgi:bacterioferritin
MNKFLIIILAALAAGMFLYLRYPHIFTPKKIPVKQEAMPTSYSEEEKAEIIALFNKAFADEWLAYYQYWLGAKVIKGNLAQKAAKELMEHAGEEYKHAGMLTDRIMELGGLPLMHPKEWLEESGCGFTAPTDSAVKVILEQNIKGEQCAIKAYNHILEVIGTKDPTSTAMITSILNDEIKHEKDLTEILEQV